MLPTSPPGTYYYPSQAPAKYGDFFPSPHMPSLQTIGGATEETAANRAYHERKDEQANEMVRAFLFTNKKKDEQKLVRPLPPSGRIQIQNGVAVHIGTKQREPDWDIRYTNLGAQPLMVGGVMDTAQGRMYVKDRLKSRIDELNALQSGSFTPQEPTEKTTKKEVDAASVIYQLLLDINAYLIEGVLDQKVVDLANGVVGRLFSDGNTLNVSDVSRMLDITYRLERDLDVLKTAGYAPTRGMAPTRPGYTQAERQAIAARRAEINAEIEAGNLTMDEAIEAVQAFEEQLRPDVAPTERTKLNRSYLFLLDRSLRRILGVLTTLNKNIFATDADKRILLDALRPTMFKTEVQERPQTSVGDLNLPTTDIGVYGYNESSQAIPQPGQEAPTWYRSLGQFAETPESLSVPQEFSSNRPVGVPRVGAPRGRVRQRGGRMYNPGRGEYQMTEQEPSFFF